MRIDPFSRPVPSAGPPPRREELVELARDVVESGAALTTPRFCSWLFGHRRLDPEEVPDKLQEGKVQVRSSGAAPRLAVQDAEDLTEVAVFQGVLPPETLERPNLVTGLKQLSELGWAFASQGNDLDSYGAYNVLTEQGQSLSARQGNILVGLPADRVEELASFYQQNPLGQLERQGFQFFDAQGKERPSWGDQPPAQVGKDGRPWLSVDQTAELPSFAQLVSETGSPELARRVQQVTDLDSARTALKSKDNRSKLIPGILRACEKATADEVLALGSSLSGDAASQKAFLQALTRRADTASAGQFALKAFEDLTETQLRNALLANLPGTRAETGAGQATFYQGVLLAIERDRSLDYAERAACQRRLGDHALGTLKACADTRAAAELVERLSPQNKAGAFAALLKTPTASTPEQLWELAVSLPRAGDLKLQGKLLAELPPERSRLPISLHSQVSYPSVQDAICDLALETPSLSNGQEAAAFYRGVLSRVDQNRNLDYSDKAHARKAICEHACSTLKQHRDTARAVERMNALQPKDRTGALQVLLQQATTTDLTALGRSLPNRGDVALQDKLLAELPAQQARLPLELRAKISDSALKDAIYDLAMEQPKLATGAEQAAFYVSVLSRLDSNRNLDWQAKNAERKVLCQHALVNLQSHPDTRAAAARMVSLAPKDQIGAVRILLKQADTTDLTALGHSLPHQGDFALQDKLLAELPPEQVRLPRELRAKVSDSALKDAIYELALQQPGLSTGVQQAAFYVSVLSRLDSNRNLDWQEKNAERKVLCQHALATLQAQPDTQAAAARMVSLAPKDQIGAVRILLRQADTTDLTALGRSLPHQGDFALQDRLLAELPDSQTRLARNLRDKVSDPALKDGIYELAIAQPKLSTGAEVADFYEQVLARVDANRNLDWQEKAAQRRVVAQHALVTLRGLPDTRAAAERVLSLQPKDHVGAIRVLLKTPDTTDLKALGRALPHNGDPALQDRLLAELGSGSSLPIALRAKVTSPDLKDRIYELAIQEPDLSSGQKMAGFYTQVLAQVDANRNLDWQEKSRERQGICRQALASLKSQPDTARGATLLESWAPSDLTAATRELLKTPVLSGPAEELQLGGRICGANDTALQDGLMAQLASTRETQLSARLAQDCLQLVKAGEARQAICQTALEHPRLDKKEDIQTFMDSLDARLRTLRYDGVAKDREKVRSMAAAAVEVLLLAQKPAPSAIDEQESRVIVGGVPIKKKDVA